MRHAEQEQDAITISPLQWQRGNMPAATLTLLYPTAKAAHHREILRWFVVHNVGINPVCVVFMNRPCFASFLLLNFNHMSSRLICQALFLLEWAFVALTAIVKTVINPWPPGSCLTRYLETPNKCSRKLSIPVTIWRHRPVLVRS